MAISNFFKTFFLFALMIQLGLAQSRIPFERAEAPPVRGATASMTREQCRSVDLSARMGPVRNQVEGSCYAYAATELLNFGRSTQYSALHLALTYTQTHRNDGISVSSVRGLNGGFLNEAVQNGLAGGMCPESALPSIGFFNSELHTNVLRYYERAINLGCQHIELTTFADTSFQLMEEIRPRIYAWADLRSAVEAAYPGLDIFRLESIFKNETSANFFTALATAACSGRLERITGKTIKNRSSTSLGNPFTRQNLLDHINDTLNQDRPVGISYQAGGLIQSRETITDASHASAIAGREWLNEVRNAQGQVTIPAGCYFLVKNSWGEEWRVPDGVKAMNVNGRPGYFMMSEQAILEHVFATTSLD